MTEKTLNVLNGEDNKIKVSDVELFGNVDTWILVCKASSKKQGWMKSTKVMNVPGGCIVQVSTQQDNNPAEAITFVPGTYYDIESKKFCGLISISF